MSAPTKKPVFGVRSNVLAIAYLALAVGVSGFAQAAQESAPRVTLISNVDIFDGQTATLLKNRHVLVKGNRIETVSDEPLAVIQTDNVTMIDGGGRVLMPGMIDAHWHALFATMSMPKLLQSELSYLTIVAARANRDALMRGFTTVRDVGGNVFALKQATDEGIIDGPRIYPSGSYISQTGGHGDFLGRHDTPTEPCRNLSYLEKSGVTMIADGVPEVTKRAREIMRAGASQIKVMAGGGVSSFYDPIDVTQYSLDEMKAIVQVAESYNTYVTVHAFTPDSIRQAIEAGVKCIEHGHLLDEPILRLMAKKGVWLSTQPILDDEDAIPFPEGSENRKKFIQVTDGTDNVYKVAKKLKVKTAWGTDTLFDPELAKKQGKMVVKMQRWYEPHEILKMVTHDNAQLLKLSGPRDPYPGKLGFIEEGAYADLILVDGNPLENLDLVADAENNFVVIMRDGKIYKNTLR
jgi:imidazolonepropionase-like amidohydrolase